MTIEESIYFELGKLNYALSRPEFDKSRLIQYIAHNSVYDLKLSNFVVEVADVLDPNVNLNSNASVVYVLKNIKLYAAAIKSKSPFTSSDVYNYINALTKGFVTKEALDDVFIKNESNSIKNLKNIYFLLKNNHFHQTSIFVANSFVNYFFVRSGLLKYPVINFGSCNLEKGNIQTVDDFLSILLAAIKSTLNMLAEQEKIITSHRALVNKISTKSVTSVYNYCLTNPILEVGQATNDLNITFATASKAFSILEQNGILSQVAGNQRYRIFCYIDLFNTLK